MEMDVGGICEKGYIEQTKVSSAKQTKTYIQISFSRLQEIIVHGNVSLNDSRLL